MAMELFCTLDFFTALHWLVEYRGVKLGVGGNYMFGTIESCSSLEREMIQIAFRNLIMNHLDEGKLETVVGNVAEETKGRTPQDLRNGSAIPSLLIFAKHCTICWG